MFPMKTVVNRRNRIVEKQFDGMVIKFQPYEKLSLPENIARCLVQDSPLQIDIATGLQSAYELGIEGETKCDPLPGEMATKNPLEVIDRTNEEADTETEPHKLEKGEATTLGKGKKAKK